MGKIATWFSQRFSISGKQVYEAFNEHVPYHLKHWWFCLGGTAALLFVVQIFTGLLLCFYYTPTGEGAYESVKNIIAHVEYGWLIRNVHKWGATFMVVSLILHQMRVFFTGAYRKPRELNWMIGMLLLCCTLFLGFTGYSLVYDQLSYWGVSVVANITESVPLIGTFLKRMMLGGEVYNEYTLSRIFILHAAILPLFLSFLLVIHIAIIRIQGISELKFEKTDTNKPKFFDFFPDHFLSEMIIGLFVTIVIIVLATVLPSPLGPKADPLTTPDVIKPEWYFLTAFRLLKLFSRTVAILSTGAVVIIMILWPFIDGWVRKHTRFKEISVWIGIIVVLGIITLTLWESIVEH